MIFNFDAFDYAVSSAWNKAQWNLQMINFLFFCSYLCFRSHHDESLSRQTYLAVSTLKIIIKKLKRQPIELEKSFKNFIIDKGLNYVKILET